MKTKILGLLGTAFGIVLFTAHVTHAPLWILGLLGIGMSANFSLIWVQITGAIITLASIILLLRKTNMKQNTIVIAVTALLIGGTIGYSIAGKGGHNMKGMDHSMMMSGSNNLGEEQMGDMMGMDHSAMMVSSEHEFVAGMIPHHQEAVDTATEVLERGGSTEEIRTLASEIIIAQETEIAMLKEWHLAWYGEEYVETDTYQPMMRDLSQLSGMDLDRRFLEDMIPHHMGAIMMAQSVRPHIEHQEVADMADAIMETQTAEIELMQNILQGL